MRTLLLLLACGLCGCGEDQPPRRIGPPPAPVTLASGHTLTPSMSDAEILSALDLAGFPADGPRVQGVDGTMQVYGGEGQMVTITRSIVTGVFVLAEGPRMTGAWSLGAG